MENDPETGDFICAGVYGDAWFGEWQGKSSERKRKVERVDRYFSDLDSFQSFLLSARRCQLVFFNLAYDKEYLKGIIAPPKLVDGEVRPSVLENAGRCITLTLQNGVKAFDLANHVDGSLADWISYLDMGPRFGIHKAELSELYERVMNDARATFQLGTFLEDFYWHECGVPIQLTVASTALRLFEQHYFTDKWERQDTFLADFEHQAYYGGRTELFRRGKRKVYAFDVNSMYLSVMRDSLIPDPQSAKYMAAGWKWKDYLWKYDGIYRCRVKAPPDVYVGVLPKVSGGKLVFPAGEFTGSWASPELRRAVEAGYEVVECYDFVIYRQSKPYFRDYADFVWESRKRYRAQGNTGMDKVVKKLGNALYGKFAQRNPTNEYFGKLADYPGELPEVFALTEYNGEPWITVRGTLEPSRHYFPVVAAFITSYARLKLYDVMSRYPSDIVYCDTDSVHLAVYPDALDVGSELGQWEFQGEIEAMYWRPKFYGDKHKGVPARAEVVEETDIAITFAFKRPLREREAIRRGDRPNRWVDCLKCCTLREDKRLWDSFDISRPPLLTIE